MTKLEQLGVDLDLTNTVIKTLTYIYPQRTGGFREIEDIATARGLSLATTRKHIATISGKLTPYTHPNLFGIRQAIEKSFRPKLEVIPGGRWMTGVSQANLSLVV